MKKEINGFWTQIPVVGDVPGGKLSFHPEEIIKYISIDIKKASKGEFFGLRVQGFSMAPKIQEGDIVIVKREERIVNGNIVVVNAEKELTTVKKYKMDKNGLLLMPLNPEYDPIFYSNQDIKKKKVKVIGKVIEVRGQL